MLVSERLGHQRVNLGLLGGGDGLRESRGGESEGAKRESVFDHAPTLGSFAKPSTGDRNSEQIMLVGVLNGDLDDVAGDEVAGVAQVDVAVNFGSVGL